jgi:Glyoxalase-like domain
MAIPLQITVDARDPRRLAAFWAVALGYELQPPRSGYLVSGDDGGREEQYTAIVDPAGIGPRLLFQRVPEPKTLKNRVHLDVNAGHGALDRRSAVRAYGARLVAAGATVLREMQEESGWWIVLTDPEDNEFCLQ